MSDQRAPEQIDAALGPPLPPPEPQEAAPSMLATLSPAMLCTVAVVLTLINVGLVWFYIPSRQSDIAKRATARDEGQIRLKDSIPLGDGRVLLSVQFVYPD